MRRNMTYGLLVLFMLFLITANPSGTGENGRQFVDWLSGGWDDTREFVSSLVGDAEGDTPARNQLGEVIIPTVPPAIEPSGPGVTAPTPPPPPTSTPLPGVVE